MFPGRWVKTLGFSDSKRELPCRRSGCHRWSNSSFSVSQLLPSLSRTISFLLCLYINERVFDWPRGGISSTTHTHYTHIAIPVCLHLDFFHSIKSSSSTITRPPFSPMPFLFPLEIIEKRKQVDIYFFLYPDSWYSNSWCLCLCLSIMYMPAL